MCRSLKILYILLNSILLILLISCKDNKNLDRLKSMQLKTTSAANDVAIMYVNAGRADCAIILLEGKAYLVDAGEEASIPSIFAALEFLKVEALDGVFLTHTHGDHVGGLPAVSQKYKISTLYSAEISENKKNDENKIVNLAKELAITHEKLNAGDNIELAQNVFFEVLAPYVYNSNDDNDNSLVLRLNVNGKTFLFTGDMQFAEEKTLLHSKIDLSADVLKVGNHGNPDSTSNNFAKAVSPQIAVISTDTSVDTDSANSRVKDLFSKSQIYITENYEIGILMEVDKEGKIDVSDPEKKKGNANIEILNVSKTLQTVTIKNKNKSEIIDISGYFIISSKGGEVFVFPSQSILPADDTITIGYIGSNADYIWKEKSVWNKKNEDIALMYDKFGNLLASCNSN